MTQALPRSPADSSRLVRFLSELDLVDADVPHQHFAERLAQLIDLPASISLSNALSELQTMAFEAVTADGNAITRQFLDERASMVNAIASSFVPGAASARISLPAPGKSSPGSTTPDFEPYLKFYKAQQRQIDFSVQQQHKKVRNAASGLSPELARLAALDTALNDTLSIHSRKFFAAIPRLLALRFEHLLQENPEDWGHLHEQFCAELRELLLAETEARLMPVLGLVEAINSNTESTIYE
jgi:Protein of unknown function (DUF3348)